MRVRCYPTIEQADREALAAIPVVVVDVLRSTSCIVAGLDAGAKGIIPVEDVVTASRIARPADKGIKILAGEWKGHPVEGFDLFNSPTEFTTEAVGGKTVVLATSNGTRAIVAAGRAPRVLICAILNVGAVAEAVTDEDELVLLCSGNEGAIALEDLFCAGLLLQRLRGRFDARALDDAGRAALMLAERYGERIEELLRESERGRKLLADGYEGDIVFCARIDDSGRVPLFAEGVIR